MYSFPFALFLHSVRSTNTPIVTHSSLLFWAQTTLFIWFNWSLRMPEQKLFSVSSVIFGLLERIDKVFQLDWMIT
jgi:hypothetical protein